MQSKSTFFGVRTPISNISRKTWGNLTFSKAGNFTFDPTQYERDLSVRFQVTRFELKMSSYDRVIGRFFPKALATTITCWTRLRGLPAFEIKLGGTTIVEGSTPSASSTCHFSPLCACGVENKMQFTKQSHSCAEIHIHVVSIPGAEICGHGERIGGPAHSEPRTYE